MGQDRDGEDRAQRLNLVLRATRDIHRLIVREKDPAELARQACGQLVSTGRYRGAWIVLEPVDEAPLRVLASEPGPDIDAFGERLATGWRPACWGPARASRDACFLPDPVRQCPGCPLWDRVDLDAVLVPLRHEGVEFGMLGIRGALDGARDPEEASLLRELADDLGLALHAIRSERRRALYAQVVEGSEDALALISRDYVYLHANSKYARFWNATADALVGRHVAEVTGGEYFELTARRKIDASFAGRTLLEETSRDVPGIGLVSAEVRSAPGRAPDGTIVAAVITVRDVTERRHAERRERESEARLSVIFNRSPLGIVFTRMSDGLVLDANEAFLRLFGLGAQDVIGRSSVALGLWADPAQREEMVRELHEHRTYHNDAVPIRQPNGSERMLRIVVERIDLAGTPYTLGLLEDITEHRRSAARQRESEQRLAAIFHHSPVGILLSRVADRRIVDANASFTALVGWSRQEMLERTPAELGLWADPEEHARADSRFRETGGLRDLEMRARRRDGAELRVRLAVEGIEIGGEAYYLSVVEDITERRQVEEALRARDRLLHEVQRVVRIGGWERDLVANTGSWTDGCAAIFDFEPDHVPPSIVEPEYFPGDAKARLDAAVEELARTGRPFDIELEMLSARGVRKPVRVVARPVFEDGRVVKIWGALQDLTAQKQAEAERGALEDQLRSSQKLEAIGRLAGGVAHDFNNLLVVILNYADFALESLHEGDPLARDIAEIRKAGERAAALTRQLLAFSRRQMFELAPLDLNHAITGLESMLRRILGEDIEFLTELAPGIGVVMADAGQIEQVVMNVVVNARDAMPQGGTLCIATSDIVVTPESPQRHAYRQDGRHVELRVTDTGCGMDAETQARVFEPFFTTKEVGRGTGLGLATSYGIVKQTGGAIWVESEPGRGTTVRIHLPCTDTEAVAVVEAPVERVGGHERILVVEDETALRDLVRRVLEAAGYHVLTAANGDEALGAGAAHAGEIDLLLTDVVMPRIGGRGVAEALRRHSPALRVLFMSGYSHEAIEHHGVLESGPHLLAKPFSATELLRRVRQALDRDADTGTG